MEVANVILTINCAHLILEAHNSKKQYQGIWWRGETLIARAEEVIQF